MQKLVNIVRVLSRVPKRGRRATLVLGVIAVAILVEASVVLAGAGPGSTQARSSDRSLPAGIAGMPTSGHPIVGHSYKNDRSIPVRQMRTLPPAPGKEAEASPNPKTRHPFPGRTDTVVQHKKFPNAMPAPILNFDGIAVPRRRLQLRAARYEWRGRRDAVRPDRQRGLSGLRQDAPGPRSSAPCRSRRVWSGFGGVCQSNGDGDPVVLYDQLANRWLISQFAGSGIPTDECIAVSTTSDATGSWNRYGFHLGSNFFDYPKLGVWPDAYYMSDERLQLGGHRLPRAAAVRVRPRGDARRNPATFVSTGIPGAARPTTAILPADLDGRTLPPAGARTRS